MQAVHGATLTVLAPHLTSQASAARALAKALPFSSPLLRLAGRLYVRGVLMRGARRITCRLVSLSQVMDQQGLPRIDLLKVRRRMCGLGAWGTATGWRRRACGRVRDCQIDGEVFNGGCTQAPSAPYSYGTLIANDPVPPTQILFTHTRRL